MQSSKQCRRFIVTNIGELKGKKNIAIFAFQYLVFIKKILHSIQDLRAFDISFMSNLHV